MKSSLKKMRGFAFRKHDQHKQKRETHPPAYQDELVQASQDMVDMKDCYDGLLSAAAATVNSAYEFSEALKELGACILEKTALNEDEESMVTISDSLINAGSVLLMLGKAQFELQKHVDRYRVHVLETITTPSESLLKELQIVEEMKRQCDEKRDFYNGMIAAQRLKGTSRNPKAESFTIEKLREAQDDYQEEATLFVFRLKSLKQGQFRSLLTQAARHHATQLNFFRKGVESLEVVEPHVKVVAEQQHIDYQFINLEDDDTEEEVDDFVYDDGEVSFGYGQYEGGQEAASVARNSMEEYSDKTQKDSLYFNKEPRAVSMSAPLLANKKVDFSDRISQLRPASTKKYHTYVLPTPLDERKPSLTDDKTISASRVETTAGLRRQLWYSSPLKPNMPGKDSTDLQLPSPIKLPKAHSLLKENINSGQLRIPPLHEELSMSQFAINASDAKKIKRQAFSGPLTGHTPSNKTSVFSAFPTHTIAPQPSMAQKLSQNASPPISSPKINELHELPRPPVGSKQSAKPSSLVGHSGPLMYRCNEFRATSKLPLRSSQTASPLPTPPGAMARSFSIPSSSQRSPTVSVSELLEVPTNQNMTADISSPSLTPISLSPSQPPSRSSESVSQTSKPRGKEIV
ncbi:hypothetical protein ZIOFF_066581 [Zingiber officinale]|uniref:BAR domain-containing protein n=1 Tax=Zingiber officinale TaxID=94328 RepID=A0A8J5F376_ZINOF|nr:hypothetical protein ZIOFF_066581 [Zingiber officinale]